MKPVHQTLFGAPSGPVEQIGNCYPACIATLLDIQLADVPHVYMLHPTDDQAAADTMLAWLQARRITLLGFDWAPWVHRDLVGMPCIMSGKSPRGDFNHAVVGEVTTDGWRLLHDPHPSGAGLDGDAKWIGLLVPYLEAAA